MTDAYTDTRSMPDEPAESPLTSEADVSEGLAETLRATAILADVTIGVWSGECSDSEAMEKVARDAGARGKVGRVVKNLMAGADARLRAAKGAFSAVRTQHRLLTQPWPSNVQSDRMSGPRLLPNVLFEQYASAIGRAKGVATDALDAMLEHYEADKAIAMENLAGMAKPEDYPTVGQLREQFYARVDFEPLPAGSGFSHLPPRFAAKLADTLRTKQEKLMGEAQNHLWRTLRERAAHAAERFGDPECRFKNSTIEHLEEMLVLAPGWNVIRDPRVDEALDMLRHALQGVDPKEVRKNDALRASSAERLRSLVAQLDEWDVGQGG